MKKRIFALLVAIPVLLSVFMNTASAEGGEAPDEDEGFTVVFEGDAGVASITVYDTQDYEGESVSLSPGESSVSRDGDTGAPDSTGSGQVNFTVVLNEGYTLSDVTAEAGTYKNVKGPADTGLANTYRITKITASTTVTITTVACGHGKIASGTTPEWVWSADFGTADLSFICAECGESAQAAGTVTSVLTNSSTITFTASATVDGAEFTDTKTAAPFKADFVSDEGVMYIYVYHTQDYTEPDDDDASSAVARDSDTGCPVITGDGQINFAVILYDGYEIDDVIATPGAYKNIKGPSETEAENTYRITKIKKDLEITITTKKSEPVITPVRGDCNGDGNVSNKDVTVMFRYLSSGEGDADPDIYDFNMDGEIDNKDVVALFRYVSTLEN